MYTIRADGELMYSTDAEDVTYIVLNPELTLDINDAGSLSFVLPPGNVMYDRLKKMKTIVTVEQDGVEIFRGRVTEDEKDYYNQKNVYCEGDKSFLLDSLYEEQVSNGSAQDFFRLLIDNHNNQVEEDKQFTVGLITAVGEQEPYEGELRVETRKFWDTSSVIDDRLIGVYGGYLRTRTDGDVHYIDWLAEYSEQSQQDIRFSVNLLDLKDKADAGDVFTILIPLGYSEIGDDGTYTDPVNIKSVNNGIEYIQDDEGVAKHGKIWRTKTWGQTKDPSKLLEKAREYLKTGGELKTLTLNVIDMHFVDGNIERIKLGDKVNIITDPHGVDVAMVCAKMDVDLLNPEKTVYTFGMKPQTLTEGVVRAEKDVGKLRGGGGGRKGVEEEAQDIIRWATIFKNEQEALIQLSAGEINKLNESMSEARIDIDGLAGKIDLKVNKDNIIAEINLSPETVRIAASKIVLDGYVTASTLQASIADLQYANSMAIETELIRATQGDFTALKTSSFNHGDELISKRNVTMGNVSTEGKALSTGTLDLSHSHSVSVSDDGTVTFGGAVAVANAGNFKIADTKAYKDGVSAAANNVSIQSISGWKNDGKNTVTLSNRKTSDISLPSFSTNSGSWSGGNRTVSVYWRDNNGANHTADSVTISIPTITVTWSNPQQNYAMVTVSVGGKSVTSSQNISNYG